MCKREGYEYRYRIRVKDDEIPNRNKILEKSFPEERLFFVEIRTNFVLKKRADGEEEDLMGSEISDMVVVDESCGRAYLIAWMGFRLRAYWMPDDEIESMLSKAYDFAKHRADDNPDESLTPVVVDLDVCTVQLEEEPIDEAYDRAIRTEFLIPVYLWANHSGRNDELHNSVNYDLQSFLITGLAEIRVEDVDQGLSLMEMCSICLRNPTVGTQVSVLRCGHAFHYHCIVRWFMRSNSCPLCRFRAHSYPVCKNLPCVG